MCCADDVMSVPSPPLRAAIPRRFAPHTHAMPPASVYDSSRRSAGGWRHSAGSDEDDEGQAGPSRRPPQSRSSSRAWVEDDRGGGGTPLTGRGNYQAPASPGAPSLDARLQALREQVQRTRDALDTASGDSPHGSVSPSVVSVPELAVKGGALFMEGKPVDNVHQKVCLSLPLGRGVRVPHPLGPSRGRLSVKLMLGSDTSPARCALHPSALGHGGSRPTGWTSLTW